MLRQYELVDRVLNYDPEADEALLNRAYVFSVNAHGTQKRASGDPYFSHPIEVAGILTDLHMDDETIATAILHDTIEDTVATPADIQRLFGDNIARMVDGVTKLSKIEAQTDTERAAENLRKFLLAMSDDIRVLLVKLADRLHNMRTLHHLKDPEKRRRIARETMDIYAPLAERIGMYEFMKEMQSLAFARARARGLCLDHQAARRIEGRAARIASPRSPQASSCCSAATASTPRFRAARSTPIRSGRRCPSATSASSSSPTSWRSARSSRPRRNAIARWASIHRRWPMVPGRFKDYISTPKRNGYRSLHTSIIHAENMRVEIQIRTQEMHAQAEFGLAAHWAYKHDAVRPDTQVSWIRDLIEILEHCRKPRGAARAYPDGDVSGPNLRLQPQGRADPAAQGRDPDRLRLCGPFEHRRPGGGRQGQRPGGAAAHRDPARRPGPDPAFEGAAAAGELAQLRDHRQGARSDPPPHPPQGARGDRSAGAQALRRDRPALPHPARRRGAPRRAQAAQAPGRRRADGGDRPAQAHRRAGNGGGDARLGRRRCARAAAAAARDRRSRG